MENQNENFSTKMQKETVKSYLKNQHGFEYKWHGLNHPYKILTKNNQQESKNIQSFHVIADNYLKFLKFAVLSSEEIKQSEQEIQIEKQTSVDKNIDLKDVAINVNHVENQSIFLLVHSEKTNQVYFQFYSFPDFFSEKKNELIQKTSDSFSIEERTVNEYIQKNNKHQLKKNGKLCVKNIFDCQNGAVILDVSEVGLSCGTQLCSKFKFYPLSPVIESSLKNVANQAFQNIQMTKEDKSSHNDDHQSLHASQTKNKQDENQTQQLANEKNENITSPLFEKKHSQLSNSKKMQKNKNFDSDQNEKTQHSKDQIVEKNQDQTDEKRLFQSDLMHIKKKNLSELADDMSKSPMLKKTEKIN